MDIKIRLFIDDELCLLTNDFHHALLFIKNIEFKDINKEKLLEYRYISIDGTVKLYIYKIHFDLDKNMYTLEKFKELKGVIYNV